MGKKNFLNKVLQNTSCPQGFWGRMILRGMNCFHASLANRGMMQLEWQPEWNVLFSCIFSQSWHEASGMAAGMECA